MARKPKTQRKPKTIQVPVIVPADDPRVLRRLAVAEAVAERAFMYSIDLQFRRMCQAFPRTEDGCGCEECALLLALRQYRAAQQEWKRAFT